MTHLHADTHPNQKPRPDIITDEFVAELREARIVEAHLFGSVARGDERPDSDIDLFVVFAHDFRLSEQLNLMVKLSRLTGRDVEVVTKIDPLLEPHIRPTLVTIPI